MKYQAFFPNSRKIPQNLTSDAVVIGERSGSVVSARLETEGPRVQASPVSLRCVLEQDTFILA